jgi:putative sugar O-methyltransferase
MNMTDADSWKIEDDLELLDLMLADARNQPAIYQPGKFWIRQSKAAVNEIRKFGLANFRGRNNGIGLSFADKQDEDVRQSLNFGPRKLLKFLFEKVYPFNKVLDGQVGLTHRIADEAIREKAGWLAGSARIQQLQTDYKIPYSLGGGCMHWCEVNGQRIANHYLTLLDSIDLLKPYVDFANARTFFEIGGGFGINLHLLLSNFPGIRKCVYLDIPPTLYVGTQYLKSHFGSAVRDYRSHRRLEELRFADNDELEILCITPWQIEKLRADVDLFHNAHSFAEMPEAVVQNYASHVEKLLQRRKGAIALASYDWFDTRTTIHPDRLPGFFTGKFEKFEAPMATTPGSRYFYYVRNG